MLYMLRTTLISKKMEAVFLGRVHKDFVTEMWGTQRWKEKGERKLV